MKELHQGKVQNGLQLTTTTAVATLNGTANKKCVCGVIGTYI